VAKFGRGEHEVGPEDTMYFNEWKAEFEASDAYREGDKVLGLDAWADRWGCVLITMTIERGGEELVLNPYFNQSGYEGDEDEEGRDMSDGAAVDNDPREFIGVMAGATNWREWEWPELSHFV
jgi:hypothetical protein